MYMMSSISSSMMILQAAGADVALERLLGDRFERLVRELQLHVLELHDGLVLPDQLVLRLVEDLAPAPPCRARSSVATTGSRPTNSGIRPNLIRSSGMHLRQQLAGRLLFLALAILAPKPIDFWYMRRSMTSSRPTNAPPQMKRMLVVSIWMNSWCGCLRPPCGGTLALRPFEDLEQRLLHALAARRRG